MTHPLLTRKFVIAESAIISLTIIAAMGLITGTEYLAGIGAVVGMFSYANLKEKERDPAAAKEPTT